MITVLCCKLQGPLQVVNSGLKPGGDFWPVFNLAWFTDGLANKRRSNTVLIVDNGDRCAAEIWMSARGR